MTNHSITKKKELFLIMIMYTVFSNSPINIVMFFKSTLNYLEISTIFAFPKKMFKI